MRKTKIITLKNKADAKRFRKKNRREIWAAPKLTSRLISAEPCVKMAVRSFLPYVRFINEGQNWKTKKRHKKFFILRIKLHCPIIRSNNTWRKHIDHSVSSSHSHFQDTNLPSEKATNKVWDTAGGKERKLAKHQRMVPFSEESPFAGLPDLSWPTVR